MEQIVIFILSSHQTLKKKLESLLEIRPARDILYFSTFYENITWLANVNHVYIQIFLKNTSRNVWRLMNSRQPCSLVVGSTDIVFIRTWYPVTVPNFYNPVTSLLLPPDQKETWQGMRSVGQLRRDLGMKAPCNSDSLYKVGWCKLTDSIIIAHGRWLDFRFTVK